jgi:hypothetical protein
MLIEKASRHFNWIEGFKEYTEVLYAPSLFRKWAAIGTIAGAIERKVWTVTRGDKLYPNTYILLVGPAGVGKGLLLKEINRFWRELPDLYIAPVSVTKSSLIDALNSANRKILRPTEEPPYIEFHALAAAIPEFSDFASMYDPSFMSILQSLWDCVPYEERKRTKDIHIKLEDPVFSLIAGTTPAYLNTFMPEGAWDQGFASRTFMIFSGETLPVKLFDRPTGQEALFNKLTEDLKRIFSLYGQCGWTKEAAETIQNWVNSGEHPLPEHRRLLSYTARRKAHLIKLCIVASVARCDELLITLEDFQTALDWMLEAETFMPEIFKAMASGGDSQVLEDTWHYVWRLFTKDQKPIPESRIINFIADRAPAYNVNNIFDLMIRTGMIQVHEVMSYGKTTYKPTPKTLWRR